MIDPRGREVLVGTGILDLVTFGMYGNPLAIYREYVQNAADSVEAGNVADGRVEIDIDVEGLRVTVRDNGPGLSHDMAVNALLPIGDSEKRRATDRGFRGIGRLCGLAFAETVTFVTREGGGRPPTRVVWDGTKLRAQRGAAGGSEDVIRNCTAVDVCSGQDYPPNFFEVQIAGIGRHAAGLILNRNAVRKYISEVCPVPMSSSFPYAAKIRNLFQETRKPLVLDVAVDKEGSDVRRLDGATIRFSSARQDEFREFQGFRVPSVDTEDTAAIGWVAHSSYLGALPKEIGIRGLRARVGNIQVGDESVFDSVFPEERFNRWCVGEVHIVDSRIVPNARRDYFEPGPHVRNLENHLGRIAREIASRCRKASTVRHEDRRFQSMIAQLEETYELVCSGYLARRDAGRLADLASERLAELRVELRESGGDGKNSLGRLNALEMRLRSFDAPCESERFRDVAVSDALVYQRVFSILTEICPSPRVAREMIAAVLARV
ncbi:MAG: ATP-binding protein [Deltaproteobacteria bacterium]|nr:ATP-binding protein [Deltaproteobacteria bacterium]